jgi:transposase
MTMTTLPPGITGGVDTHLDVHVAAALDHQGALLGVESFPTTTAGYRRLSTWLASFGDVDLVGVEGTGSYGAGLTRHLLDAGVRVVEVDRPNRQRRRRRGKSDPQDAITAARAAQSGDARGAAKTRDGNVESMRVLRVARSSARVERARALNQMRSIISTAPDELRAELRDLTVFRMLERAASFRPGARRDVTSLTKLTLRMLARRAIDLRAEIEEIDVILAELVAATAPALMAHVGLGVETASALLVAAGDNPLRLRSERTFDHLCGVAPIYASSGKK